MLSFPLDTASEQNSIILKTLKKKKGSVVIQLVRKSNIETVGLGKSSDSIDSSNNYLLCTYFGDAPDIAHTVNKTKSLPSGNFVSQGSLRPLRWPMGTIAFFLHSFSSPLSSGCSLQLPLPHPNPGAVWGKYGNREVPSPQHWPC